MKGAVTTIKTGQQMNTEESARQVIDSGRATILDAERLMTQMALMLKKLNIKSGAGRRYLQRVKPGMALLHQAENLIRKQRSGKPHSRGNRHRNIHQAMARHGRA